MEVAVHSPSMDSHFNGGRSKISTYPVFGNYFYSAPSSPMRMSEIYRDFDELQPSQMDEPNMEDGDFAFDICRQFEAATLSADELFDDGKIRAFEIPPQSPVSQQNKIFQNKYSTDRRKGPTETIIENTERKKEQKRGRERGRNVALSPSASRRAVRSVSPNRFPLSPWNEKHSSGKNVGQLRLIPGSPSATSTNSNTESPSPSKGSRRWRLKDLFRSASEGRGTGKDPLRKYSTTYKKQESFKTNNSRNGPVSTNEQHFSVNRAAEEKKKKTFLPYKGILGGLLFNPAVHMHTNFRHYR